MKISLKNSNNGDWCLIKSKVVPRIGEQISLDLPDGTTKHSIVTNVTYFGKSDMFLSGKISNIHLTVKDKMPL